MRLSATILAFFLIIITTNSQQLQDGFVYVQNEIPTIQIELRYFSSNNFIGNLLKVTIKMC